MCFLNSNAVYTHIHSCCMYMHVHKYIYIYILLSKGWIIKGQLDMYPGGSNLSIDLFAILVIWSDDGWTDKNAGEKKQFNCYSLTSETFDTGRIPKTTMNFLEILLIYTTYYRVIGWERKITEPQISFCCRPVNIEVGRNFLIKTRRLHL